jgi:hypothetical protein
VGYFVATANDKVGVKGCVRKVYGVGNTTQVDAVAIGIFDVGYINVFFAANVKICSADAVVGLNGVSEF